MYYQRNISQNNINAFNNCECLIKEEQTLLIYKTILNLPLDRADIKKIDKIKGKVECDCPARYLIPKMVTGDIKINLSYQSLDYNKNNENIFFALPFQAPLFSKSLEKIEGSLKYITARRAGERHIIIETVIALEGKGQNNFREDMKREGNLKNTAKFMINISHPNIIKIIASQQKINIMEYQQVENTLEVKGIKQIELVYIGKTMEEEYVIKDGKVEPFFEKLEINQTNRIIKGVEIVEDNLSAVQLNPREVLLDGSYGLRVIYAPELNKPEKETNPLMGEVLETVSEKCKEDKAVISDDIVQENKVEIIEENPVLLVESKDEKKEKQEKAMIVKRKSKRAELLKHKRELHNLP